MNVHPHGVNRTRGSRHHLTPHAAHFYHPLVLACPFTDASVAVSVWLAAALGLPLAAGTGGAAGCGCAFCAVGAGAADACPVGWPAAVAAVSPGARSGISLSTS